MSFALHKSPQYIVDAARIKYGRHIFVLGAAQKDIETFWKHVGYAVYPGCIVSPPVEKGKTIVDIDTKCHINDSVKELEEGDGGDRKHGRKPDDWYDDFQITSKKSKGEVRTKSYSLEIAKTTQKQIGGNLKIAGPSFFNVAGGGIAPELGINANYSKLSSNLRSSPPLRTEHLPP